MTKSKPVSTLEALEQLREESVVRYLTPYNERVVFASPGKGLEYGEVARRLSLLVGGQVFLGSAGVTHSPGGRGPSSASISIFPQGRIEEVLAARKVYEECTGEPAKPWSVTGVARELLLWTGLRQAFSRPTEALMRGITWHYQHCMPGRLKEAHLWDIKSCYYSLLCRLPSPYVYLDKEGLPRFFVPKEQEEVRWHSVLTAVKDHKKLRNCLLGCASKLGGGVVFSHGKERETPSLAGCLRPAALLVVRTAYELCALAQVQTQASYANTDCVITPQATSPEAWQRFGLVSVKQASGDAELCSVGIYRVGEKGTKWFWKGSRFRNPCASASIKGLSILGWLKGR
jgi:hypothetical protein